MGGPKQAKLELHELGWRELELEFVLEGAEGAIPLTEPARRLSRDLLLALEADIGAGREAEEVLGLNFSEGARVRVLRRGRTQRQNGCRSQSEAQMAGS